MASAALATASVIRGGDSGRDDAADDHDEQRQLHARRGKVVLAACFVTDLGTVVTLGLIFAPFTLKTLIFVGVCIGVLIFLPWITAQFFRLYVIRGIEPKLQHDGIDRAVVRRS
jgi:hypothetical protein